MRFRSIVLRPGLSIAAVVAGMRGARRGRLARRGYEVGADIAARAPSRRVAKRWATRVRREHYRQIARARDMTPTLSRHACKRHRKN